VVVMAVVIVVAMMPVTMMPVVAGISRDGAERTKRAADNRQREQAASQRWEGYFHVTHLILLKR
jgi:hypothetical protein